MFSRSMIKARAIAIALLMVLIITICPSILTASRAKVEKTYFAVFINGKKVGYSKHIRRIVDNKVITENFSVITIGRMGVPMTVRIFQKNVETISGKPLAFTVVQNLGVISSKTEGVIDEAGKVHITITTGSNVVRRTFDWPADAVMDQGLLLIEKKMGHKEGTRYKVKIFDATLLRAVEADVSIGKTRNVDLLGRVVPLTEVTVVMKTPTGVLKSIYYDDENYRTQKSIAPMLGMTLEMIACSKQFALSKNDVVDFINKLILTPPEPIKTFKGVKKATYTLVATKGAKLHIPTTDNQTVQEATDEKVVVIVKPRELPKGEKFPYKGNDKVILSALKPTQYLQCNDEKIKALAKKAIGGTTDAAIAARRIEAFVNQYIQKKDFSIGYASASEVARSRQGDCTEHAVLAAAMCRAIGIPAQVVAGIAYVENFAGKGKGVFGPHAWVRVFIGGKWYGIDPALNGYDAGHIALAAGDGNLDDFFGIISTLGYFKIAKIQIERE